MRDPALLLPHHHHHHLPPFSRQCNKRYLGNRYKLQVFTWSSPADDPYPTLCPVTDSATCDFHVCLLILCLFLYPFLFAVFHWRLRLKCDGTRAETRFCLSAKRTSPFKSAGASVQSTTGSRCVCISVSNAGYTKFRGSEAYWLPTPLATFPFNSPPVRHPVPSRFNCAVHTLRLSWGWLWQIYWCQQASYLLPVSPHCEICRITGRCGCVVATFVLDQNTPGLNLVTGAGCREWCFFCRRFWKICDENRRRPRYSPFIAV